MSPATIRFQELIPERDEFELADGSKIPFRSGDDFDASDLHEFRELHKKLRTAREGVSVALPDDAGEEARRAYVEAAKTFDDTSRLLVRFILPDIPDEALAQLHMQQCGQILSWWNTQQMERKQKKGLAGQAAGN